VFTPQPLLIKSTKMESGETFIEPLLHKAEEYSKTSFEILKLKTIDKAAAVTSSLISRLLLIIAASFFLLALNIALALWLGDLMGRSYYGFLIIAGFYGIVAIILFSIHPRIKISLSNTIITQMLN
jgi:hypothetical protein